MILKAGDKVVLSEHDDESPMNLQLGWKGEVLDSQTNIHGWIYCSWPEATIKRWWVNPACLKLARAFSLENK